MKKSNPSRSKKFRKNTEPCFFCTNKSLPDYQNPPELARYVTDRGKIISRSRTGICQKHQRRLTVSIKRARHLALLTFIPQV